MPKGLNEFSYSIIFLAIPGIIAHFLLKKLLPKSSPSNLEVVLLIFVYSVFSYSVLYIVKAWSLPLNFDFSEIIFIKTLIDNPKDFALYDIIYASIISFLLVIVLSYASTYTWLNRSFSKINASRKFGDKDVWNFFHNLPANLINDSWLFVRDHEKKLTYYGRVVAWSGEEPDHNFDLYMQDVDVFKDGENEGDDSKKLYSIKSLYLNQKPEMLSIETPPIEEQNEQTTETQAEAETSNSN